jgi:NAD(P)-dependent dehydrogenase (short-subunit alcohol dehydrogenase family)
MAGTIIVTGASAGIGRATVDRFAGAGWNVAALARRADALADVAAGRANVLPVVCDVTDPASVEAAFGVVVARFGRVDALFNNAGMSPKAAPIDEIPVADWLAALDVNLTGMFLCARAAFAQMRRQSPQGGRIINNGSISASAPRPGSVPYTTTKHGVTGLTRTLALDGRPYDIAAGQIDIGNASTEMAAKMAKGVPQADGAIRVEPLMDVREVADAVFAMAALPLTTNVLTMTIMATKMPFVGRG